MTEHPEHAREHPDRAPLPASPPEHPDDALPGMPAPARRVQVFSVSEAARRCSVGRATIQRALSSGRIEGAEKTDNGWEIPAHALVAAGFHPNAPSVPDEPESESEHPPARTPAREHARSDGEQARELADIRQQLEAEKAARVEAEHAREQAERARYSAEIRQQQAEALAQAHRDHVDSLRMSLRMLEARPEPVPEPTPEPTPEPAPTPEPLPTPQPPVPSPSTPAETGWDRFKNRFKSRP